MYGETGRFPLYIRQNLTVIKYWYRILQQDPNSILKNVYRELMSMHDDGHITWCDKVFNILKVNGQENIWVDQINVQPTFINILKSSLFTSFISTWHNSINNSDTNPILRIVVPIDLKEV